MNLPSPIQAYFDADRSRSRDALISAFAPHAVVEDEGRTHVGHQAIADWWDETKDKYRTTLEPLEAGDVDDITTVCARVTGQFPGSPALIRFMFRLDDDRISRLGIEA